MNFVSLVIISAALGQKAASQWKHSRTTPHAFVVQLQAYLKPICLGFMKNTTTLVAPASCVQHDKSVFLAVKAVPKKHKRDEDVVSAPFKVNKEAQPWNDELGRSNLATFQVNFTSDIKSRKLKLRLYDIEDSLDQNSLVQFSKFIKLHVYRFKSIQLVSRPYRLVNGTTCHRALKTAKIENQNDLFCVRPQTSARLEPLTEADVGAPMVAYFKQHSRVKKYFVAGLYTRAIKFPRGVIYVFTKPRAVFEKKEIVTNED
ncbi:hypothetical protein DSO57_1004751 [Entomophthora muscae]|uniref:Uncharacterized protein n=1 Tax=Entomophthora muscae TaxID=34485 RepID=A0ACC2UHQ3_9FUNG|nr:hypothetical protein DSO57_1004751 [Entomophthora muscae]